MQEPRAMLLKGICMLRVIMLTFSQLPDAPDISYNYLIKRAGRGQAL